MAGKGGGKAPAHSGTKSGGSASIGTRALKNKGAASQAKHRPTQAATEQAHDSTPHTVAPKSRPEGNKLRRVQQASSGSEDSGGAHLVDKTPKAQNHSEQAPRAKNKSQPRVDHGVQAHDQGQDVEQPQEGDKRKKKTLKPQNVGPDDPKPLPRESHAATKSSRPEKGSEKEDVETSEKPIRKKKKKQPDPKPNDVCFPQFQQYKQCLQEFNNVSSNCMNFKTELDMCQRSNTQAKSAGRPHAV